MFGWNIFAEIVFAIEDDFHLIEFITKKNFSFTQKPLNLFIFWMSQIFILFFSKVNSQKN